MLTPVLSQVIRIRVSEDDLAELNKAANERDISQSAMVRIYFREGLAKYDRKHTQLMEQIHLLKLQNEALQKLTETSNALSSAALAAVSLLEAERFDRHVTGGTDRLKGNIKTAFGVGTALAEGFKAGAFT